MLLFHINTHMLCIGTYQIGTVDSKSVGLKTLAVISIQTFTLSLGKSVGFATHVSYNRELGDSCVPSDTYLPVYKLSK